METLTALFIVYSMQFNLPQGLLSSVCWVESNHKAHAYSHNDGGSPSYGVCQVKFQTAQFMGFTGKAKDLQKPEINIHYSAKYLAHQLKRYNGDVQKALIAYNQGSAKSLTRTKYSDKVLKTWRHKANEYASTPVTICSEK